MAVASGLTAATAISFFAGNTGRRADSGGWTDGAKVGLVAGVAGPHAYFASLVGCVLNPAADFASSAADLASSAADLPHLAGVMVKSEPAQGSVT